MRVLVVGGMNLDLLGWPGQPLLPRYSTDMDYLQYIVDLGAVDGVTKDHVPTVDSYPTEIKHEILDKLYALIHATIPVEG